MFSGLLLWHLQTCQCKPIENSSTNECANEQQTGLMGGTWQSRSVTSVCWKNIFGQITCYAAAPPRRHFNRLHSSVSVPTCVATTKAGIHGHCQPRPLTLPSALMEAIHSWIAQRTAAMRLPNQAKVANEGRILELWMTPSVGNVVTNHVCLVKKRCLVGFFWRARNNISSCVHGKQPRAWTFYSYFCLERMCDQLD